MFKRAAIGTIAALFLTAGLSACDEPQQTSEPAAEPNAQTQQGELPQDTDQGSTAKETAE